MSDARRALARERQECVARIRALESEFSGIADAAADSNGDDEHDPEGATVGFERAQVTALLERSRQQLREIEAAIAREAAGAYGVCEVCGRDIPADRLAARPTATTCVPCAESQRRFRQ
jgi:RNA polymerase-binding transcription factor DksA